MSRPKETEALIRARSLLQKRAGEAMSPPPRFYVTEAVFVSIFDNINSNKALALLSIHAPDKVMMHEIVYGMALEASNLGSYDGCLVCFDEQVKEAAACNGFARIAMGINTKSDSAIPIELLLERVCGFFQAWGLPVSIVDEHLYVPVGIDAPPTKEPVRKKTKKRKRESSLLRCEEDDL